MKTLVLSIILLSGVAFGNYNGKIKNSNGEAARTGKKGQKVAAAQKKNQKVVQIKPKKEKESESILDNPYKKMNDLFSSCCSTCPIYRPCE
ncbi:hypothetical protein [Lacihabitans soyangensis]|uniref:Uncharacterized protein n=1 Tax=Lacihabitans soyangensis TaxID=869394 RepID=A0AAE3KUW4_9BACT|nr:hypothetical protein [Lacihabitans soyangensis]MCP9766042.1 hypothetical protein [Lacihabitans soyangensis]